jgi:PTS system cellobiose-specific IIA component
MKEKMQETAFQIIAAVGTAKSSYVEAMYLAREKEYDKAMEKIKEGDEIFNTAHHYHFELVQLEANGETLPFSIIFMHAEDQLLSTETIKLMAEEIIFLRKEING